MVFLSIVVPAFDEERRLPRTLDKILAYLAKHKRSSEVVVVDDGSRDGTAEVAEGFAKLHKQVRVLRNPGNRGKGYSIRHGVREAAGEWILFTDADLSAPIEELEKLFRAIEEHGAQVAIGSRALDRSLIGVHQSWFRENAGRLFNLLMRIIVGLPFWDTQCGFKLFRRDAAQQAFGRGIVDGFGFDVEVLFIARKLGHKIVEVPVRWDHADGTKLDMTGDSAKMFADLLRVRWNDWRGVYRR
ncbi:MAG: glycosyltransferase family 2 protein [Bryobacteraceae bacterium]|nr:glycosyltransferase family 2 protein [Bryobacteraceae bacterium]